jgi:hypothetical protein
MRQEGFRVEGQRDGGRAALEMVAVLDEDPDLGRHLSQRERAQAVPAALAPLIRLATGSASFLLDEPKTHAHLGLLVLDGLLVRHIRFGQIDAAELLGPGDLLRPWVPPREDAEGIHMRWEVLTPTRVAALDHHFAHRIRAWPQIPAALLDRGIRRSNAQLLQAALRQARRVEDRLLVALWHFAARWGQTTPHGRTVHLPNLTGDTLAKVVGARRQSVSTALGLLADRGAIRRQPDGSLVLAQRPPHLEDLRSQQTPTPAPRRQRATDPHQRRTA